MGTAAAQGRPGVGTELSGTDSSLPALTLARGNAVAGTQLVVGGHWTHGPEAHHPQPGGDGRRRTPRGHRRPPAGGAGSPACRPAGAAGRRRPGPAACRRRRRRRPCARRTGALLLRCRAPPAARSSSPSPGPGHLPGDVRRRRGRPGAVRRVRLHRAPADRPGLRRPRRAPAGGRRWPRPAPTRDALLAALPGVRGNGRSPAPIRRAPTRRWRSTASTSPPPPATAGSTR